MTKREKLEYDILIVKSKIALLKEELCSLKQQLEVEGYKECPVRLLTNEEYDRYIDKIPDLNCSWWLGDPAYSGAVKMINNDKSKTWCYPGVNLSPPAVRPVIDVNGVDLGYMRFYDGIDTMIHCGIIWKRLNDDLYISEVPIGFHRFDPESVDYDKSEIKEWLEKWYEERKDLG